MSRQFAAGLFGSQTWRRRRRGIALSHVSVEPMEVRCLPSAVIELVADLNSAPVDQHDQSVGLPVQMTVGDLTFFWRHSSYHGGSLWRTDGTDEGTFAVLEGSAQMDEHHLANLWSVGDKLYFQTHDLSSRVYELWVSDGTSVGTQRIRRTPEQGSSFLSLSGFGDVVTFGTGAAFFSRDTEGTSVFVTDSTSQGTRKLFELTGEDFLQDLFAASDGRLYTVSARYVSSQGLDQYSLWVVEPSGNTPRRLSISSDTSTITGIDAFRESAGTVYFRASTDRRGIQIWAVNGNAAVMSPLPVSAPGEQWTHVELINAFDDGSALLLGETRSTGREIWHYNAGTSQTTRLTHTNNYRQYRGATTLGNSCYFIFDEMLWASDGSVAGTRQLIGPGLPNGSGAQPGFVNVLQVGGSLMLDGYDAAHGREWWTSDGTADGTQLLIDILPGAESGSLGSSQGAFRSSHVPRLLFVGRGIDELSHIWVSEGTAQSSRRLLRNSTGTEDSIFVRIAADGESILLNTLHPAPTGPFTRFWSETNGSLKLLGSVAEGTPYTYQIGSNGIREYWRTNNQQTGRSELYERVGFDLLRVPMQPESFYPDGVYELANGRRIIFGAVVNSAIREPSELKLFSENGATTRLARQDGLEVVKVSDQFLWFTTTTYIASSRMLWRTDGTPSGTIQISDSTGGPVTEAPWAGQNRWIFDSDDGPMVTNGTTSGTHSLKSFVPGAETTRGVGFVSDDYLFSVTTAVGISSLWAYNGISARRVYQFSAPIKGVTTGVGSDRLWFLSVDFGRSTLFVSDAQESGTREVFTFDKLVLSEHEAVSQLAPIGDRVVIVVKNSLTEEATLWISDGTWSGTGRLRHNLEGRLFLPAHGSVVVEYEGGVVFTAVTEETGGELFRIRTAENLAAPQNVVVDSRQDHLNIHWTDVAGAVQYEVEIFDPENPQQIVHRARVNDSGLDEIGLPTAGIWMVRVRSLALIGEDSNWSQPVEFSTGPKPELKSMPAESTNRMPEFQWLSTADFSSFDVWLTHRDTKSRVAYAAGVASKSFRVESPLAVGQYALWVRGIRNDGSKSDWSDLNEFKVVYPAIQLRSGGGVWKTARPEFTWDAVPGALNYRLEIRAGNGTVVYAVPSISNTTHLVAQNLAAGRYRIVVTAMNAIRRISEQSLGTLFQLALSPQNISNDAQSLSWSSVSEAVSYTFELRDFVGRLVMPRVTQAGTRFVAATPFAPGQYSFRVFANFPAASSNWSSTALFEIYRPPVVILSPTGATADATPVIMWSPASGAGTYEIEVNQRGSGRTVYAASQKQGTVHRVASILPNGQYDVRVRALFPDGSRSAWSSLVPIRIGPPVVATANAGVLQWQAISGTTHYEVWINYLGNPPARQIVYLPYYVDTIYSLDKSLPRGRYQLWIRAMRGEAGSLYAGEWSSIAFAR